MAPWNAKRGKVLSHSAKAASKAEAAATAFAIFVDPSSPTFLCSIEFIVKVIHAYCEDKDVDEHVAPFILDLGSSIVKDTKFFQTMELYWDMNVFVAQAMLAKDPEFKKFSLWIKALEEQDKLLLILFRG